MTSVVTELRRTKSGNVEAKPEFFTEKVVFHPLPVALRNQYDDGDIVYGYYGTERFTGKLDKKGNKIFFSYFIPKKREV